MDDHTEPIAVQSPPRAMRPATVAGAAALVAVLVAIGVLVWTFSGSSSDTPTAKTTNGAPSSPVKGTPIAAAPSAPPGSPTPAQEMDPAAAAGLPTDLLGGDASALLGGNPTMAAFASPGAPTYRNSGTGGPAPTVAFPDLNNIDWPAIGWGAIAPAVAAGVSGDALIGLVGNIGGWLTASGVAASNNLTDIVAALIIYASNTGGFGNVGIGLPNATTALSGLQSAVSNISSLSSVQQNGLTDAITNSVSTLSKLPSPQMPSVGMPQIGLPQVGLPSLPTPEQALMGGALAASLPSLGQLPQFQMPQLPPPPPVGLPSLPSPESVGLSAALLGSMPQIGLPQAPPIGLPQPPPIGLPQPPPFWLPENPLMKLPSITRLLGFPF